ncbi:glutathione S-transferase L3 [Citrus sinensis]|uniref:Glutathione S-transferase L3 n=1 Tax=Citrus sinensis TaxID=2711 RepID=A0ACB8JSN7_CITSI|nr:glutathione S-transferase L3 [Citrus sinensis]
MYEIASRDSTEQKAYKKSTRKKVNAMATVVHENLPPVLDSKSEQPPSVFDGTTRLYMAYTCPFAQRVWITRNYKIFYFLFSLMFCYYLFIYLFGLQDEIKLVAISLEDKPVWYKEKVHPANKVPALEHNGKIVGESLDLIKYVDSNFEGPSLLPDDPEKRKFAEELFSYSDTFNITVYGSFKGDPAKEAGPCFDYLEKALHKFDDGPFLLGQLSLVDIAYIPFVERAQIFLSEVIKYDITAGRPKLAAWIEELNQVDAYKQTKLKDPKGLVELYKIRYM